MGKGENAITERVTIDFDYFIKLAIQKQISWNSLAFMLTDLKTTLDGSKKIIRILVQELEKWVNKVENESKQDVIDTLQLNEKQIHFQR